MPRLPYRSPPAVPLITVSGVLAVLTYGSLMSVNGYGTAWFRASEHNVFDTIALGALFKVNDVIFGSDAVMVGICAVAWLIHVFEAAYAFVQARLHGGTLAVCLKYSLGALMVGVLQLQQLTAAIKRQSRK